MSPKQVDRFFRTLAKEITTPVTIILTGAAAGSLMGRVRSSADIDFALLVDSRSADLWRQLEAAIARTERLTNIQAQYAEDIDRWSSVSLLDYRWHTKRHRQFGSVDVRTLAPGYWAIGKLSRYLPQDRNDVAAVLKRQRTSASVLVRLWARALRASPRSPALTTFRHHVEDFLLTSGRGVWGQGFDATRTIRQFHAALSKPRPRTRNATGT